MGKINGNRSEWNLRLAPPRSRERGVSIVEMVAAVTISLVLTTITAPGMMQTVYRARVRGAADDRRRRVSNHHDRRPSGLMGRGTSLIELLLALAVSSILTAVTVPTAQSALKTYHLTAAVRAVTGAIQTTRYQAIMRGYHCRISFSQANTSYQVSSKVPPATTFSNVGSTVPWCTTRDVTMSPTTTLEFYPGGRATATTGSLTLTLTNGTATKTITVSGVGNVSVQ